MKMITIRRGNLVTRYHTKTMLVPETVGHHSANVAGILIHLYDARGWEVPSGALLAHTALHDIEEQFTGDIPAPMKMWSTRSRKSIRKAEDRFRRREHIPSYTLRPEEAALFKFADSLDCAIKCLEELSLGNSSTMAMCKRAMVNASAYLPDIDDPLMRKLCEDLLRKVDDERG